MLLLRHASGSRFETQARESLRRRRRSRASLKNIAIALVRARQIRRMF